MSRNGSGTYSVVNTFVAGATITAAGHNQNWADIASEMTNSVAVDGQSTMTGPLKAASGTAAAPSVTFGADVDTGIYRIGANNLGIAANGAKVVDVATTGAAVTGTLSATGAISQNGFALLPVGVVFPYSGEVAPSGYILCFGQAVSRTTYSALFTVIGGQYGSGDGSTTFNLPDLRGRVVAGKDNMGGTSANRLTDADDGLDGDTLGDTGGGETQTLVTANLPAYTPAGTNASGAATMNYTRSSSFQNGAGITGVTILNGASGGTDGPTSTAFTQPTFTGTAQGGTSTAFGVVQPTIILNYIIFAGV